MVVEGEIDTLIGHLVSHEQHLGRTLIIDLESNGFKLVDHRTI